MRLASLLMPVLLLVLMAPGGCRRPNPVNVELRRNIQELEMDLSRLETENRQLRRDIRRLEEQQETLPTLPQERLEQMWTISDLRFGRLTGIDRSQEGHPLRLFLRPVDEDGQAIKAAGDVTIEAYDLDAESARLHQWHIPLEEMKGYWNSIGFLNEYIFTLHWDDEPPPPGRNIMVRVTFRDALTQRALEARTDVQ